MNTNLSRRTLLASTASLVAAGSLGTSMTNAEDARPEAKPPADANWKIEKGRIKQSVVHWCFRPMSVEELAQAAARWG